MTNITMSPSGLILLVVLSSWFGAALAVIIFINFFMSRKPKALDIEPKTLVTEATHSDDAYYSDYDLEKCFPVLEKIKDVPSFGRKFVIGYTNVPTEDQTLSQRESYPASVILLGRHPRGGIQLSLLSTVGMEKQLYTEVPCFSQAGTLELMKGLSRTTECGDAIIQYVTSVQCLFLNAKHSFPPTSIWTDNNPNNSELRLQCSDALTALANVCNYKELDCDVSNTVWIHHSSNQKYRIIGVVQSADESGVIYVIYANVVNGKIYSRPANDWLRSMSIAVTPTDQDRQLQVLKVFEQLSPK